MPQFPKKLTEKLAQRQESNALRSLGTNSALVDFSSNDYLGFAKSTSIYKNAEKLIRNASGNINGTTGSRLLSGNHKLYDQLEAVLTDFHQAEAALVFNSGYDANVGFFSALPQRGDLIFYDEYAHASIRDGIKMSNAKSYKFKHNNLEDLKAVIERSGANENNLGEKPEVYLVTESVFSMDGDCPDLIAMSQYACKNGYHLVVDEAHAVGIYGRGKGMLVELGIQSEVFASIVTFGKAIGGHGAAILGSELLKQYLINFCRSLIYTTSLPPHNLATILEAYKLLEGSIGKTAFETVQSRILFFKQQLKSLELDKYFIVSDSSIQSVIVPGNDKVKQVSKAFLDFGYDVKAILSPTVPLGEERLRFCVHSYNSEKEILEVLQRLKKEIDA